MKFTSSNYQKVKNAGQSDEIYKKISESMRKFIGLLTWPMIYTTTY
jgi:hypothetical protein